MDKSKIHFGYIITFLILIIVILFSLLAIRYDRFPELFNFASTIVSIILAVLAIIYAYLANDNLTKNLSDFSSNNKALQDTVSEIKNSTENLKEKINPIPASLEKIIENIQNFKTLENPVKTEDSSISEDVTKLLEDKQVQQFVNITIDDFLKNTSPYGLLLMYQIVLKYKSPQDKLLNLNNLSKILVEHHKNTVNIDLYNNYFWGYMIVLEGLGFIRYELKPIYEYTILDVSKFLIDKIDSALEYQIVQRNQNDLKILKEKIQSITS